MKEVTNMTLEEYFAANMDECKSEFEEERFDLVEARRRMGGVVVDIRINTRQTATVVFCRNIVTHTGKAYVRCRDAIWRIAERAGVSREEYEIR